METDPSREETTEVASEEASGNLGEDEDYLEEGPRPTESQAGFESVIFEMVVGREGRTNLYVLKDEDQGEGESSAKRSSSCTQMQRTRPSDEIDVYSAPLRVQIRVLNHASKGSTDAMAVIPKATVLIFTILGWMMCCGGIPIVSIAMIVIGSLYVHDCRAQPLLPIYLVVGGTFGVLRHVLSIGVACLSSDSLLRRRRRAREVISLLNCVIILFQFVWFVCGCVWVYGVRNVDFENTGKDEYCDSTVYYFAFCLITVYLVFVAIVIALILSFCCVFCIVACFVVR